MTELGLKADKAHTRLLATYVTFTSCFGFVIKPRKYLTVRNMEECGVTVEKEEESKYLNISGLVKPDQLKLCEQHKLIEAEHCCLVASRIIYF